MAKTPRVRCRCQTKAHREKPEVARLLDHVKRSEFPFFACLYCNRYYDWSAERGQWVQRRYEMVLAQASARRALAAVRPAGESK